MTILSAYSLVLLALFSACASAAIVEHTFNVDTVGVERLCNKQVITTVNGSLPGPAITVNEGDSLIVHVINNSPYDMTIHWHGVIQFANGWADGPDYVTQCPIKPGDRYTYRFNVTGQEGTLWWHAHISYLRATVHGALIIKPRWGRSYPFPKPDFEVPIVLGEWWDANVVDVVNESSALGVPPNISDAFTINGQPGDLYNCSSNSTYKLKVKRGKTYLLRMVNAGLQGILFFKIANHSMTVVSFDASYTNPYTTDVLTIAPGQTLDVLLKADQQPGSSYYMTANIYQGSDFVAYNPTTATAILEYEGRRRSRRPSTPVMPTLPETNDNLTTFKFLSNITALTSAPFYHPVPQKVDERMLITIGLGLLPCDVPGCPGPFGRRISASMNNVSFEANTKSSILEAYYNKVDGIYTTDFPPTPPVVFDYTNPDNTANLALLPTTKGTKVRQIKYNSTVEVVFQNSALGAIENHPMHLHGYDFHVVGQGFGNYDSKTAKFNLVNPQIRNTVAVPMGGWAAIRFQANNPGVWFIHCHLEVHVPWGLAGVFIVENGPTPATSVIPPPKDLPKC